MPDLSAETTHGSIAAAANGGSRAGAWRGGAQAGGARRGGRVPALDGLRGVAALVVLFHHALLAGAPLLSGVYFETHFELGAVRSVPQPPYGSLEWLISYTPLHIFWAGPEFVVVFFVLSGFVLTLPVARGKRLRVSAYYPTRLLRLYLPVWAALALAACWHVAVARNVIPGASWWLDLHATPLTFEALHNDALLNAHAGEWGFTTVLWSLHWEVLFSLLLPALLLLPFRSAAVKLALAVLCFVSLRYGQNHTTLELPPFVLGMLLAFEYKTIERVGRVLHGRSPGRRALKIAMCGVCVCALTADWWIPDSSVGPPLVALGACLAMLCALVVGSLRTLLQGAPMQWLGKRAFSLYLVHEPLVVALAFALHSHVTPVSFVLIASTASLALSALFYRFAEAPFHHIARRWGAGCERWLAQRRAHIPARQALHRPA